MPKNNEGKRKFSSPEPGNAFVSLHSQHDSNMTTPSGARLEVPLSWRNRELEASQGIKELQAPDFSQSSFSSLISRDELENLCSEAAKLIEKRKETDSRIVEAKKKIQKGGTVTDEGSQRVGEGYQFAEEGQVMIKQGQRDLEEAEKQLAKLDDSGR